MAAPPAQGEVGSCWVTSLALDFPLGRSQAALSLAVEAQKQSLSLPAGQEERGEKRGAPGVRGCPSHHGLGKESKQDMVEKTPLGHAFGGAHRG